MRVSVIVPVRNEEHSIRELLDGLLNQTRKPDEIVITDGGSTDNTVQIVEEYARHGAPVRLIKTDGALPGRGRNLAAAGASCEWLGFIDAGIRPEKDWLEALTSRAQQDSRIDMVYGAWSPVTDTFFKQCAAIAYVPPPVPRDGGVTRPRFIASTLLRRAAWEKVKGFPEDLRSGEDLVFMDRVEAAGYYFVFEPKAMVHWDLRPTFGSTFKRFLTYSRYNILAGLWRQWQATILGRYLVLALLLVIALVINPYWVWIPIVCWLMMLAGRALVAIRRNRQCYPASIGQSFVRALMIMAQLIVIDVAAIIGSLQWLLLDWFRFRHKATVEAGDGA